MSPMLFDSNEKNLQNNNDTQQPTLCNKKLTRVFTSCTKVLSKYLWFYKAYNRAFKDFLSILDTLNVILKHHIIDPVTQEWYLRTIACDLQKHHQAMSYLSDIHLVVMQNCSFFHWLHRPTVSLGTFFCWNTFHRSQCHFTKYTWSHYL